MNNTINVNALQDYKKVNALDMDELEKLTRDNLKFRDYVYSIVIDNVYDQLHSDFMYDAPFDYEYSAVYCTNVRLNNRFGYGVKWNDIESWIERVDSEYCFLYGEYPESALDLAKKAHEYQDIMDDSDYGYINVNDSDYERLQNKVDQIIQELEKRIEYAIDSYLDAPDDIDYLVQELEIISDYAFDNMYIDDQDNIVKVSIQNIA